MLVYAWMVSTGMCTAAATTWHHGEAELVEPEEFGTFCHEQQVAVHAPVNKQFALRYFDVPRKNAQYAQAYWQDFQGFACSASSPMMLVNLGLYTFSKHVGVACGMFWMVLRGCERLLCSMATLDPVKCLADLCFNISDHMRGGDLFLDRLDHKLRLQNSNSKSENWHSSLCMRSATNGQQLCSGHQTKNATSNWVNIYTKTSNGMYQNHDQTLISPLVCGGSPLPKRHQQATISPVSELLHMHPQINLQEPSRKAAVFLPPPLISSSRQMNMKNQTPQSSRNWQLRMSIPQTSPKIKTSEPTSVQWSKSGQQFSCERCISNSHIEIVPFPCCAWRPG